MIIDQNNTPGAYEFPSHGLLTRLTAPGMKLLLTFKQKLNVTSEAWVSHTHVGTALLAGQCCGLQGPAFNRTIGCFYPPAVCRAPSRIMKPRQQGELPGWSEINFLMSCNHG